MTTKQYTLTLSRWHKVAERLARSYSELTQTARNTFNNTQINGYLGPDQVCRLQEMATQQIDNLYQAFEMQDALAHIRQAVGDTNARIGVSRELAEYDALTRRQKLLESILAAQNTAMVGFNELTELPNMIFSEDRYDRSKALVRVRMLDNDMTQKLRAEVDALRVRVYALADRISDLNHERLTLEISEEIATAAGL